MEELHGPNWREIFASAGRKSTSRPFKSNPGLASRAAKKARELTKKRYGEDFYDRMMLRAIQRNRKARSEEQSGGVSGGLPDGREKENRGKSNP